MCRVWVILFVFFGISYTLPSVAASAQDPLTNARQLIGQQKYAQAETVVRKVITAQPNNPQAWYLLGYALHAQQKLDEALKAHMKAAEFPAVAPRALYNAACVHGLRGNAEQAIALIKRAQSAGFQNLGLLVNDTDFDKIRNVPEFQKLLPKVKTGDALFAEKTRILHTIDGEAANDQFGWVARRIGDIDGDQVTDFVATAPTFNNGAGKIYVYSTKSGELKFSHAGKAKQRLGNGAAGAGDVNGDGTPDVIVGAPGVGASGRDAGAAFVYSGKDGSLIWRVTGKSPQDSFGYKVAGLGDLDGDGHGEFAVTATRGDGLKKDSGCCYVFSGATSKLLFELKGRRTGDQYGSAAAGSMNADHPLLVVGAQDAGPNKRGAVFVYEVKDAKAKLKFAIQGDSKSKDLGQMFVSFPGDFDGDQVPDVYASDFNDGTTQAGAGRIRIHSGATGKQLLTIEGKAAGEGFGTSPSEAGDANQDGIADLIVGAWQNREGAPSGGKVYLCSGKDGSVLYGWTCQQPGDTFGFDATGLGDVDGDGANDYLLTSGLEPDSRAKDRARVGDRGA